jgi:hypothetical protein
MYTCRKCKNEIEDYDRYCFYCGSYIGEPVSIKDDWETLNSGVNIYIGSSIVEPCENSIVNNKIFKVLNEQKDNVLKGLLILIRFPVSGINSLFKTFNRNFIACFTFFILTLQSIVLFFILERLESRELIPHIFSPTFITLSNLLLGLMFCSTIVSCSSYIITFYVFKKKSDVIKLWSISLISVISLFIGITIILAFNITNIIFIIFFLLIAFMFSLLSMFTSVRTSIDINEDIAACLMFIIYFLFIVSGFAYFNTFLK